MIGLSATGAMMRSVPSISVFNRSITNLLSETLQSPLKAIDWKPRASCLERSQHLKRPSPGRAGHRFDIAAAARHSHEAVACAGIHVDLGIHEPAESLPDTLDRGHRS